MRSFKEYLKEAFRTQYSHGEANANHIAMKKSEIKNSSSRGEDGAYGYVTHDEKKPFTVNKKPKRMENDEFIDVYKEYIKGVVFLKLAQRNPYFPRVYEFRTIDTKDGQDYDFEIEKLIHYNMVSVEEFYVMVKHMFGKDIVQELGPPSHHSSKSICEFICTEFSKFIETNKEIFIKDEQLLSALKILKSMDKKFTKDGSFLDLHEENVMFRRTPFGIQLVFTDPFA